MPVTMVRAKPGKSPKLKGKAGEIRHLIPWGEDVMTRFFAHKDASSEEWHLQGEAAAIYQCYKCFGWRWVPLRVESFLLLYAALKACRKIAHISVRRGGLRAPRAQSQNVLQKFARRTRSQNFELKGKRSAAALGARICAWHLLHFFHACIWVLGKRMVS